MELYFGEICHIAPQFLAQRKASRIKGCGNIVSCRNLFKKLQILPLTPQCISLLMSVVQNKNLFSTNIENHNIATRQRNNLCLPQTNLNIYQKGAYYSGIKIFSKSPLEFKNVVGNLKKV